MRAYLAVFVLLFSPIPFAHNVHNSSSEHWRATGLSLEKLFEIMNTEICYQDRVKFFGCMSTLESTIMLEEDSGEIKLVFDRIGHGIDSLNDIKIKKLTFKNHKSIDDLLNSHREYQREKIAYWNDLYQYKFGINFDLLFSDVVRYDAQNEKEQIASMINEFLSASYSPHDHVVPLTMASVENQNFMGIGVILRSANNQLFVLKTMRGSPADAAGLRPGDVVHKIQGKSVSDMKLTELNSAISKVGSDIVEIEFYRNKKSYKANIKKTLLSTVNVTSKTIQDKYGTWGFIKINNFMQEDTCKSVEVLMTDLLSSESDLSGFILDLRDNQGGLVTQAICVADLFIPKDVTLLEIRPTDPSESPMYYESDFEPITYAPIVTLINSSSASAAEILAGTLKDNSRSVLIGEQTFGKGSVMRSVSLDDQDDIIYYQTFALMYFPSGATNHINGIMPDYILDNYSNRHSFRERNLFFYQHTDLSHGIDYSLNGLSSYKGTLGQYYSRCFTDLKTKNYEQAASYMLGCMNGYH